MKVLRIDTLVEIESRMVVDRDWGEGGMASYCLMGTELELCK